MNRFFGLFALIAWMGMAAARGATDAEPPGDIAPGQDSRKGAQLGSEEGVDWSNLLQQSLRFLLIEHGFRLATEPGTRAGMRGAFFPTYADSVRSMHGWADGDPFYVNYVGHPMMGAVASRLFEQNDRQFRDVSFGKNRDYWKGRLRAAAFSFVYSSQFEIGPFSEATVGKVQSVWPQQGFVDFVVTPFIGMGWGIAEDALDEYFIRRVERWTGNNWTRLLVRGGLNPTRSFANMLAGKVPWHRPDRGGVYDPYSYVRRSNESAGRRREPAEPPPGVAPFEFSMNFQPVIYPGAGVSCLGGNGSAALRMAEQWQLVMDVGGCKMTGLGRNTTGDSITYMAGPRWKPAAGRRLSPHVQFLVGGQRITQERFFPERWRSWESLVSKAPNPGAYRRNYTEGEDSNAVALSAGGGVDIRFNNALALRLASLEYRRSWVRNFGGVSFQNGLQFSTGLVLNMGTW